MGAWTFWEAVQSTWPKTILKLGDVGQLLGRNLLNQGSTEAPIHPYGLAPNSDSISLGCWIHAGFERSMSPGVPRDESLAFVMIGM